MIELICSTYMIKCSIDQFYELRGHIMKWLPSPKLWQKYDLVRSTVKQALSLEYQILIVWSRKIQAHMKDKWIPFKVATSKLVQT